MKSKKNKDPKYGFFTADPIPTKEEVDAFYEKEFYDSNSKYFNNSSLLIQEQQSDLTLPWPWWPLSIPPPLPPILEMNSRP